jgi:hypothetical protein
VDRERTRLGTEDRTFRMLKGKRKKVREQQYEFRSEGRKMCPPPRNPMTWGRKERVTHFASTACLSCPTAFATYSTSTTLYGSTILSNFFSKRVSYKAARWDRIVGEFCLGKRMC